MKKAYEQINFRTARDCKSPWKKIMKNFKGAHMAVLERL
jgi:hypothetical protein